MSRHQLDLCVGVMYNTRVKDQNDVVHYSDEFCEQGWADAKLNGINVAEGKWAKKVAKSYGEEI